MHILRMWHLKFSERKIFIAYFQNRAQIERNMEDKAALEIIQSCIRSQKEELMWRPPSLLWLYNSLESGVIGNVS